MNASPLLKVSDVSVSYDANLVLADVNFSLAVGEVLALLGENGAGKSTLIKILTGAMRPNKGSVTLTGNPLPLGDTALARQNGIAVVYQELSLCDHLSVEDNILLGREHHTFGWLRRHTQRDIAREALAKLGQPESWLDRRVEALSVGQKQLVEIARAIAHNAKILILDEPTSSLTQEDAQRLFDVVRRLRDQGMGVIYVSHFLEEVRALSSSYLVLRDGMVAGTGQLNATDQRQLLTLMAGRDIEQMYPPRQTQIGTERMRIESLTGTPLPQAISLSVHRGEILGIAGLVGAGRTELLRTIFGLNTMQSGSIFLDGVPIPNDHKPSTRIRAGIAMLSEDRKKEGLAQSLSIKDNMTLSHLAPFSFWGWLHEAKRDQTVQMLIKKFAIKVWNANAPVWTLSGGNQQKVALARAVHQQGNLWLFDEPTRGIDVGTKAEIYQWMSNLAANGDSIVFVSSYFQELLATCDRIAVIAKGKLLEVRAAADWTEHDLMACAMHGHSNVST